MGHLSVLEVLYSWGKTVQKINHIALLKCIRPEDADYVLRKVHDGLCGDHSGEKTLALKILRQGYFWPIINRDAMEFVKKCYKCQIHAPIPRQPPTELLSILSLIPFVV